jgi:hypothetical protein
MQAGLSGREPLNRPAEAWPNLLEIDVFDLTKSARAKRKNA